GDIFAVAAGDLDGAAGGDDRVGRGWAEGDLVGNHDRTTRSLQYRHHRDVFSPGSATVEEIDAGRIVHRANLPRRKVSGIRTEAQQHLGSHRRPWYVGV